MPPRTYENSQYKTLQKMEGYVGRQFSVDFPSSNKFGFPDILSYTGPIPQYLIPYGDFTRKKMAGAGIHFYLNDSKFESVWNYPQRSMDRINNANPLAVLGPDFSMMEDWPLATCIYNKFRNHWCMALWQQEGFNVIPNVGWVGLSNWCFEGLPRNSVVAVSTVGCVKNKDRFNFGFLRMLDILTPTTVLIYGTVWDFLKEQAGVPIITFADKWKERKTNVKDTGP